MIFCRFCVVCLSYLSHSSGKTLVSPNDFRSHSSHNLCIFYQKIPSLVSKPTYTITFQTFYIIEASQHIKNQTQFLPGFSGHCNLPPDIHPNIFINMLIIRIHKKQFAYVSPTSYLNDINFILDGNDMSMAIPP